MNSNLVFSSHVQSLAAALFAFAILHTFLVKRFQHLARKFDEGSIPENLFHVLGEVEIVFGLWAAILLIAVALIDSPHSAIQYLESRNFTEPAFVFVILAVCASQPILELAEGLISVIAKLLPMHRSISFYVTAMVIGPLLGSFITEPAAMTVTALLMYEKFYKKGISDKLKYSSLGLLFVSISIGGTLTPYAAPPVLMVASKWGWDLGHMFVHFGTKGVFAILISTFIVTMRFQKELKSISIEDTAKSKHTPHWLRIVHLTFLSFIVIASHHTSLIIGLFLFFLGFAQVTGEHQKPIRIKEGLLVSFFLGGLVVIGGMQEWWLSPILNKLSELSLYTGAIVLTAFTDNAALTYLGSLVPTLSDASKHLLVSGAVVGGGLTVIANAPNPAGYSILSPAFGEEGISPLLLFTHALIPTIIAAILFWFS